MASLGTCLETDHEMFSEPKCHSINGLSSLCRRDTKLQKIKYGREIGKKRLKKVQLYTGVNRQQIFQFYGQKASSDLTN